MREKIGAGPEPGDTEKKSYPVYEIINFEESLKQEGLPVEAIDALYGDDRPEVCCIILSKQALKQLDQDPAVAIINRTFVRFQNMQAFTMLKGLEPLRAAICGALQIKEDAPFPLVVISRGASIIAQAHELTHAVRGELVAHGSLDDYLSSPIEKEAFLDSILAFRLIRPDASFCDFAREQEKVSKEEFPDEKIEEIIKSGRGKHLGLQKEMWQTIDENVDQGNALDIDSLRSVKSRVTEKLEAT